MMDSKAPRNVVISDFFAVKSTFASEIQKRDLNQYMHHDFFDSPSHVNIIKK